MIKEAFEAGKRIKDKIKKANGDIFTAVNQIKRSKFDKHKFCDTYLTICIKYDIQNDNQYIINMLSGDDNYNLEEVVASLCLGIMCE